MAVSANTESSIEMRASSGWKINLHGTRLRGAAPEELRVEKIVRTHARCARVRRPIIVRETNMTLKPAT